jgi:O-antigen/teichoic acid export membrane protein
VFGRLAAIAQNLSPGLRKILGNIGWLFAERILTMILAFSVGIYVIRYLGSDNFGRLSYGTSFVALFGAIAGLGLNGIVVRDIVREEKADSEILGTAFVFKSIASLATIILIGFANWGLNDQADNRSIITIISCGLAFTAFETIEFWFESQVLSGILALFRSAQLIFSSLVKLLLIALNIPLMGFVWLMLGEQIVKVIGVILLYQSRGRSIFQWKVNVSRGWQMLQDSWPLILSMIMVTIYVRIDLVMLGNMASDRDVGNYAAAIRFSEVWYFIPVSICSSVFPAIVRARQRSTDEYFARLQQLYDLLAWISIILAIFMTIFAVPLMVTLLGKEYSESGTILALHIWASPFVFLGVAQHQWLMAENFTRFSFFQTSLGAVVNVGLNLWLIPPYQGVGAAIATVISYGVSSPGSSLLYRPLFANGLMLIKALLIPFRANQNLLYLRNITNTLKGL